MWLVNRNLSTPDKLQDALAHVNGDALFYTYFTLHHSDSQQLDLIVRIWAEIVDTRYLLIEWIVDLKGLIYIGEHLHKDGKPYEQNSVIFGMLEGYYTAPATQVRTSYTAACLDRIRTSCKAILQTKDKIKKLQDTIHDLMAKKKYKTDILSQIEAVKFRKSLLQDELKNQLEENKLEQDINERTTKELRNRVAHFENSKQNYNKLKSELLKRQKLHLEREDFLSKLENSLLKRRRQLASDLSFIYPICEDAPGEHSICGAKLPIAGNACNDNMLSVSLGYTCHMLIILSQLLDLPLRYQMIYYGSKSTIADYINSQLQKEKVFPLHCRKNKDSFSFKYAMYLLNMNIAQIRFYCHLATVDPRQSLANLKNLLETELGVLIVRDVSNIPGLISSEAPNFSNLSINSTTQNSGNEDEGVQDKSSTSNDMLAEEKTNSREPTNADSYDIKYSDNGTTENGDYDNENTSANGLFDVDDLQCISEEPAIDNDLINSNIKQFDSVNSLPISDISDDNPFDEIRKIAAENVTLRRKNRTPKYLSSDINLDLGLFDDDSSQDITKLLEDAENASNAVEVLESDNDKHQIINETNVFDESREIAH
ncbi:uncharacterized protein TRIADDRAFT_52233 [Trichoplax adhaerens]|uniref:UV radiation resistance-associated gene protein n=1 Tax=Trichoplax adhaerens TaxID=10228 RepID=B3RM46_TRIAD|nr:hypothetical protein TRIADDRAFT_52233 [Trichoplax adhaerens]EDV29634.1 hypothetical protein TRIADDRAFT_52233 [Trichoplax adhaerens]|eukprot:XP_002108836.1 hypothetical protein TRIADDRAFT_52233 [Trichoplax adhaerens]